MSFFSDLVDRGIAHQCTPQLETHLAHSRTFYLGIDPTGDTLHIGHYFGITLLKRAYEAGHRIILLVGGATAQIGDPSGKNTERPIMSRDIIAHNTNRIATAMAKLIGIDPDTFIAVDNTQWLSTLSVLDFLRDAGKYINIAHMLDKETVQTGMHRPTGMSYAEFSYQLLQAYDYLALYKRYGCTVQIGGSDQWGNIIQGVELVRKVIGAQVHALSFPLITDPATGKKFGKTESGAGIWLDATKTHPYTLYQFLLNTSDDLAQKLMRYFSNMSLAEIQSIETTWDKSTRGMQKKIATEIVTAVHGVHHAQEAERITNILFHHDITNITSQDVMVLARVLPTTKAPRQSMSMEDMLITTGLAQSKNDARRLLSQQGIHTYTLGDSYTLVRKGKREYALIIHTQTS